MRDLHSNILAIAAHAPAVVSATASGASADLQGFKSAAIVVNTGAIAGAGDFAASVEESDNDSDWTAVVAADLLGAALPDTLAAASVYQIGYRGTKRYIRVPLTKAGGTSIAAGVTVIKGHPDNAPTG